MGLVDCAAAGECLGFSWAGQLDWALCLGEAQYIMLRPIFSGPNIWCDLGGAQRIMALAKPGLGHYSWHLRFGWPVRLGLSQSLGQAWGLPPCYAWSYAWSLSCDWACPRKCLAKPGVWASGPSPFWRNFRPGPEGPGHKNLQG